MVRRHPQTGQQHLDVLRWGFLPYWAESEKSTRQPINARAETVATSPLFRHAFTWRRALVPAGAFFEWRKTDRGDKQPFAVARVDSLPTTFAGLWESWRGPDGDIERSFAIITTDANADVAALHDRMPVIVAPSDWPVWLGEAEGDPAYPPAAVAPWNTARLAGQPTRERSAEQRAGSAGCGRDSAWVTAGGSRWNVDHNNRGPSGKSRRRSWPKRLRL